MTLTYLLLCFPVVHLQVLPDTRYVPIGQPRPAALAYGQNPIRKRLKGNASRENNEELRVGGIELRTSGSTKEH